MHDPQRKKQTENWMSSKLNIVNFFEDTGERIKRWGTNYAKIFTNQISDKGSL